MLSYKQVDHPYINMSKAERTIDMFLIMNNIKYTPQYKNDTCRNPATNYLLRYDFAILNDTDFPIFLIEADGRQHYQSVKRWGGEKNYDKIKRNDAIKNNWAKENNIPLLRIHYWDFNKIEGIISEFINI